MSASYPSTQSNQQTIADAATINWNVALGDSARVVLGGNRFIANPTNLVIGRTYILCLVQDLTGSRVPTWDDAFIWSGGVIPTPTAQGACADIYTFYCSEVDTLVGTMVGNFLNA